ncbi:MAG: hypothetical protein GY755_07655 [Chloroflexi bacterium]|nr:hypothetical protein [Chloroflexota bacterium]
MKENSLMEERGLSKEQQAGGFFIWFGVLVILGMTDLRVFGYSSSILMALLPLYWFLIMAYRVYQREGEINGRVLIALIPILFPFLVIGSAVMGFSLVKLWPIGIIVLGVIFLLARGR